MRSILDYEITNNYDKWQLDEIEKGLNNNLDVNIYSDRRFSWEQMYEIRKGLESGINIKSYISFNTSVLEMKEIREYLEYLRLLEKRRRNNE